MRAVITATNLGNFNVCVRIVPSLDKAAVDAITRTKFLPAKKDGINVKSQVQIPVTFKLD